MYPMHSQSAVIKLAIPCGDIISRLLPPPANLTPLSKSAPSKSRERRISRHDRVIPRRIVDDILDLGSRFEMNFSDWDRGSLLPLPPIWRKGERLGRGGGRGEKTGMGWTGGDGRGRVVHASTPHDAWLTRVARDPLCRGERWNKRKWDGKGIRV